MTDSSVQDKLRALPSVEEVLQALKDNSALCPEVQHLPHSLKADVIRKVIDVRRKAILGLQSSNINDASVASVRSNAQSCTQAHHQPHTHAQFLCDTSLESILNEVIPLLELQARPSLRNVVNATGVIVHTNLGRSALATEAIQNVVKVSKGYSTLEYNTQTMERGSRHDHCEELICALTGAEAAIAVNNNAAAVMMVLHEFARGREAVISRGELIEIGGSFRIPDIMDFSQAHMVEVGTTNKTHLTDYERAITNETALLLKVHTSNYRLIGFTESVEAKELKKLANKINEQRQQAKQHVFNAANAQSSVDEAEPQNTNASYLGTNQNPVMVYEDLGSGLFIRPDWITADDEPTVAEAYAQGCDLVSFSGDKLLGGPQAGIIIGRKDLIDRLKKNPLARALRLDKMTLAALEATLRLYLDPKKAMASIPTLRMLCEDPKNVKHRAQKLKSLLEQSKASSIASFVITEEIARAGGGSLPMFDIPSYGVEVSFTSTGEGHNAQSCMEYLVQKHPIPIIGRISHQKLIFDARTLIEENDLEEIVSAVNAYTESCVD